jgi:hypothetical protein
MSDDEKTLKLVDSVENDFDCYHNFKVYRVEGNIDRVLEVINQQYRKLMNEMKSIKLNRLSKLVKKKRRKESTRKSYK